MLKHYFRFISRIFRNNISSYSFNILGLSLGFFAAISALYLITTELGYNSHFPDSKKIYRVLSYANDYEIATASNAYDLATAISSIYPEITDFCRTREIQVDIRPNNKEAFNENLLFVDSSFVEIFDHKFIIGNPKTAFQKPNSLIITSEYAKKLFGKENPIGETVNISWYSYTNDFIVTGIIKEPKRKSTIDFGLLANISVIRDYSSTMDIKIGKSNGDGWVDMEYQTYIKLTKENLITDLSKKITENGVEGDPEYFDLSYLFQPIRDIYLSTMEVLDDPAPHGSLLYIIILSVVGLIILFISCFNYIILSTSQAMLRTKEFGIRKVFGANNKLIFFQTITEYIFFSLIAVFLSIILVELTYPIINNWFGRDADFSIFSNPIFIPALILVIIITVFFSTFYLNVFITRSNPISAIAGIRHRINFKVSLHHLLIGLQLLVYCIIFTSLLSINNQIKYLNSSNVGLNMDDLIVLSNPIITKERNKFSLFKSKIITNAGISSITTTNYSALPAHNIEYFPMRIEGNSKVDEPIYCDMINVNYDFVKTFGIKLKSGQDLTTKNFPSRKNCCLISQSAVDAFHLSEPIGEIISILNGEMYTQIVGVVEDFYVTSFYKQPKPMVLTLDLDFINSYYIRLNNKTSKDKSIKWIKKVWEEVFPDTNFTYSFYKNDYKFLYQGIYSTVRMVIVFSLFALILSIIGLYGMSNHVSNLRIKEMSLRRLFGATVKENFNTIIKSFFILTLICNIVSIPISMAISNSWLRQFSFHTSFSYINVFYTFLVSLFILLIAISGNMLRTVNKPIIEGLKEKE